MNENAVIGCKDLRTLSNRLESDGRPDLRGRVDGLREQFRKAVEYTRRAGEVGGFDEFRVLLDEMINEDPKVLPDIYVVNAGISFCTGADDCKVLLDYTKTYGIPVGAELYGKWMEVSIPVDADWKKYQELFVLSLWYS